MALGHPYGSSDALKHTHINEKRCSLQCRLYIRAHYNWHAKSKQNDFDLNTNVDENIITVFEIMLCEILSLEMS